MNEYSSDTKKVAAKLAGMTDACANVHDDERMTELFALAPEEATHIDTEDMAASYLKHLNGDEYAFLGMGDSGRITCILTESNIARLIEIPPRERELNNLADKNELPSVGFVASVANFIFDRNEIQTRREQRIAAGLIDVDDTNEPYATWDDVPDDLKPAAEECDLEDAFAYLYYNVGSYHGDHDYTEAQWKRAREIYEAKEYCLKWDCTDKVEKQDSQQTRIADAIMSEVGCDEVGYSQCVAAAEKVIELTQDSQQEWVNDKEVVILGNGGKVVINIPQDANNEITITVHRR